MNMTFCMQSIRRFSTRSSLLARKEFLVIVKDYSDPECLQRRLSIRNKHLAEAKALKDQDVIRIGGALLDSHESGKMKGSMIIYSGESVEEIEKVIRNDPYVKNKVWESWEIYPFKRAFANS